MNSLDPEVAWHSEKSNDWWFVLLNLKCPIFTLLTLKIALQETNCIFSLMLDIFIGRGQRKLRNQEI